MKWLFSVGISIAILCIAGLASASSDTSLQIGIESLGCQVDTLALGTSTIGYLTPDECATVVDLPGALDLVQHSTNLAQKITPINSDNIVEIPQETSVSYVFSKLVLHITIFAGWVGTILSLGWILHALAKLFIP